MEFILNIFSDGDKLIQYFQAIGSIVLAAKALTVITPSKLDDRALKGFGKLYNFIAKFLNIAALNIGKDKNADA